MRRAVAIWMILTMAVLGVAGAVAEGLQAPDYVMEGYDGNGANHDWESNLFFQRMQEDTGIAFEFRQHTDMEKWTERKEGIAEGLNLPDVLFKAELTYEETLKLAEQDVLLDLTPYLEEYAPDLWAILQAHPEYLRAITLPDGTIRALPAVNELAANNLVWINQTWLDNLKLEMPGTADQLTETLRAFLTGDPNRNGRADEVPLSVLGMWDLRFLAHAFGITDNDYYLSLKDGQVQSALTSDENRAFLTWLHGLWEENLLSHQSFITADTLRQITDEKAAITYGMFLSTTPLNVVPASAMGQYTVLTPLEYEGRRVYRELVSPLARGTFALTRTCPEPERMIAWVNRLYTEEGSILIQVGREGEEYVWNEDGQWEWNMDLQTVANEVLPNNTLADGGTAPGIITLDFQMKYADKDTSRLMGDMVRMKEYAVTPFPLVNLEKADAAEIAKLQAEIAPWAEKRMAEFVTGDVPLNDDTWAEFTREVENRGMAQMLALWQKYAE